MARAEHSSYNPQEILQKMDSLESVSRPRIWNMAAAKNCRTELIVISTNAWLVKYVIQWSKTVVMAS